MATPAAREAIVRAVQEIAGVLRTHHPPSSMGPSLGSGACGLAVLFSELASCLGIDRYADEARSYWEHAVSRLKQEALPPGLLSGIAGVGWTSAFLENKGLGLLQFDVHEALEESLLPTLDVVADRHGLDLADGLVGVGVYALERLPHPRARRLLAGIVEALAAKATPAEQGLVWRSACPAESNDWRSRFRDGYVDLGMAHGTAGIVSFLSRVVLESDGDTHAHSLLARAVSGLRSMRQESLPFRYASLLAVGRAPIGGRLAWCYGDLAVAASLMLASQATGESRWRHEAIHIAAQTPRRGPSVAAVKDVGFCHGAAGVAHLLQRLHSASGDTELAQAAHRWLDQIFSMRKAGHGVAGFMSSGHPVTDPTHEDPGLLTGSAGTALALLSTVSDQAPHWDRVLLLSPRVC